MGARTDSGLIEGMGLALRNEEEFERATNAISERILTEIPGYDSLSFDDVAPLIHRHIGLMLEGIVTDQEPTKPAYREIWVKGGEQRAGQGVPLEDMLHGWRIGLDVIRQRIHISAEEVDAPPGALLEMLETALKWTDAGMLSAAAGHREAELDTIRQQRDHRVNFLRRVLSGGLTAEDLRTASGYSINRQGLFHAIRARPADDSEALKIQRQLQPGHSTEQRDGLIGLIDGDIRGFVAMLPSRCESTIGVSPPLPLTEMAKGFRLASRALDVALALGTTGISHFDQLGLLPAVQTDDEVSAALFDRHIAPIEGLGQSGDAILETVELFIRNGLRYEMTAKELFVHVNTVRYRVNRFEEMTGQSLRNGDTIVTVWWSLTHRRLRAAENAAVAD